MERKKPRAVGPGLLSYLMGSHAKFAGVIGINLGSNISKKGQKRPLFFLEVTNNTKRDKALQT